MGYCFLNQQGGAALNFKVAGGTTQPESPSENTIWVKTDKTVTGWVFSPAEPGEPTEGMVWITIGTAGTISFNALKKNGIQIYPLGAKQYDGGAWADRTAMSFQNGVWSPWWNGELYDHGNRFGGWEYAEMDYSTSVSLNAEPLVTYNPESMVIKANGDRCAAWVYKEGVDLTKFKTLVLDGTLHTTNTGYPKTASLNIWSELGAYLDTNLVSQKKYGDTDLTIDVSALTGEHRIGFFVHGPATITVNSLKLL